VELRHLLCGEQVDVGVRNSETSDDKARARGAISSLDSLTDFLRAAGNMQPGLGIQVGPLINLLNWNDQGVAVPQRLNAQKRHALVSAVHETARQLAVDDLGKYRRLNFSHDPML